VARNNYRERICTCGKTFIGTNAKCRQCRRVTRACAVCGKRINSEMLKCSSCQMCQHVCAICGQPFIGKGNKCGHCRPYIRECVNCGASFRGANNKCWKCRAVKRTCECGKIYIGCHLKCPSCFAPEHICLSCERKYRGTSKKLCTTCRFKNLPENIKKALRAKYGNVRRERKYTGRINDEPVSLETYLAIIASGPCVYCGKESTTVDHITPLSRGGYEAESNLVPACLSCNQHKHASLITEWIPARVQYALEHSGKVSDEYLRLSEAA